MGVTGAHRNLFYALGYSGHGLALGALAGRVLRDLYSGDHAPWRDLPFYQKRLPTLPSDVPGCLSQSPTRGAIPHR